MAKEKKDNNRVCCIQEVGGVKLALQNLAFPTMCIISMRQDDTTSATVTGQKEVSCSCLNGQCKCFSPFCMIAGDMR